ncbi:MAG: translation elongation factor Ts [Deltaproteobacteria bacterium]|nr:MAG: translation elongation factor Ts [Deltaproteobacteria bacterium]
MEVSARTVQQLRAKTGAGIMDCKKALAEEGGDLERAVDYLRKKGLSAAAKKAGRAATEGTVGSYIHAGGKIGVLVEINSETDFVGRNQDFQAFVKDVAMHVAAASPRYVERSEVPEAEIAREKEVLRAQIAEEGKPEAMVEKILEGRLGKFYKEFCLLEQPFVRQPDKSVEQILAELVAKIGERIVIRRFARFVLGEGLVRRSEDFASEVAKAAAGS